MSGDVLTPNRVVLQLAELGRQLDMTVEMLKEADGDATEKRHAADVAESRAFVNAEGAMDMRKHLARLAVDRQEDDALVAEALVRHLRARLRATETRIEIGRSMNSALRAELAALPYGQTA